MEENIQGRHQVEGDLGRCGDLLAQRFKAIEAALHHEIIPNTAALSTQAELTQAAKAELRAQKLRQQIHKGSKQEKWAAGTRQDP